MTSRTFQHRVTLPAVVVIMLVAALAFSFFMSRDTVLSVMALLLVCLDVVILERVIHLLGASGMHRQGVLCVAA